MPKVYVTRKVQFCASHRLHNPLMSDEQNRELYGKCNREHGHGHNYELEVTLKGEVDPFTGMFINLRELKRIMEDCILNKVDHFHLNHDVPELKEVNPTTENLVVSFWNILERNLPFGLLYEVKLFETENNIAKYYGENGSNSK